MDRVDGHNGSKIEEQVAGAQKFINEQETFFDRIVDHKKEYLSSLGFDIYSIKGSFEIHNDKVYFKSPQILISACDKSIEEYLTFSKWNKFQDLFYFSIKPCDPFDNMYDGNYSIPNINQNFQCNKDNIDDKLKEFLYLSRDYSTFIETGRKKKQSDDQLSGSIFLFLMFFVIIGIIYSLIP